MASIRLVSRIAVSMLLVWAGGLVLAQISPERRQLLLDYQLTLPKANQLISAMSAMTKYLVSMPDYKERLARMARRIPAENVAAVENDPKAMAILKDNGLTAREYLIGVPALRMAILAAQGRAGPSVIASPANVAFAKANLAELKPKLDAADGLAATKN